MQIWSFVLRTVALAFILISKWACDPRGQFERRVAIELVRPSPSAQKGCSQGARQVMRAA
jgi:hypothetical protein